MLIFFLLVVGLFPTSSRLLYKDFETPEIVNEYSKLLNNQHIVMMGDSLMRYQYLSLVHLVHTDTFVSPDSNPNILLQRNFNGWADFYNVTNNLLKPNEYCDCFRVASYVYSSYENRYYRDSARNISITYIQYFGDSIPQHGNFTPPGLEEHENKNEHENEAFIPYKWEYTHVEDVLTHVAARLTPKPLVLVLNAGHWANFYMNETHRESVLGTALSLFDRVIWKRTSAHKESAADPLVCAMSQVECLDQQWTFHLSSIHFMDYQHFRPDIYNDINRQFIRQLHSKHALVYTLLPLEYVNCIVSVMHMGQVVQYLVDKKRQMRKILEPPLAEGPCYTDFFARVVIKHTAAEVKLFLGGDDILDYCVYMGIVSNYLIRASNSKSVYLLEDGKRSPFNSLNAFISRGYDFDNVHVIAPEEMERYPEGPPLT